MKLQVGQAIHVQMDFADGGHSYYPRPFLIVDVSTEDNTITLLNCSSVEMKAHKVGRRSNCLVELYDPPLNELSMIKLDGVYEVDYFDELVDGLYKNGSKIDTDQYNKIMEKHGDFLSRNPSKVHRRRYSKRDILVFVPAAH